MAFTVAILGRPNVGKSTLFNRLVGRREALVHPSPGVTRDRREGTAQLGGLEFRVIDTAGLDEAAPETMAASMQAQTGRALAEADVVLFLIDARAGVTPLDRHFADRLRRTGKPVLLLANKCEGRAGAAGAVEAFELGLGAAIEISAEHGEGMADLHAALADFAEVARPPDEAAADQGGEGGPLRLAIVGRPNVGKSTLVNRLLGEARVITGPEPGVTRESIATDWEWQGRPMRLVDTAGMRRRARVSETLEFLSLQDARETIRFAELVVVVLDATEPAHRQDLTIASHVAEEGRALVLALNKWDLVEEPKETLAELRRKIETSLAQLRGVRLVTLSALTGRGVARLMPAVFETYDRWNTRIPTGPLNRWLAAAVERHPPPAAEGRRVRLRYITQVKARPPTFALFTSRPQAVQTSYLRYLINGLRDEFGLDGVPIRIHTRRGRNPYIEEG